MTIDGRPARSSRATPSTTPDHEARLGSGRAAILFRPLDRIHLGASILLTAPLRRLSANRFPRTVLLMDFGIQGERSAVTGLTEAGLDRLACLPEEAPFNVAAATAVPSIARLAAVVASTLPPQEREAVVDSRVWFRDILLAAGLLATRATHVVVEAGTPPIDRTGPAAPIVGTPLTRRADLPASELMLARRLASRVDRILPGTATFPVPLLSGYSLFRSLDGHGPMGASPRGTLYLSDSPEEITRKVRAAVTDDRPYLDPEREVSPGITNLLLLLHATTEVPVVELIDRFAGRRYSELKTALADAVNVFLAPIRARRAALAADETGLSDALRRESGRLETSAGEIADALTRAHEAFAA